jgi:3-oxoacid CoA-transferase subunit A
LTKIYNSPQEALDGIIQNNQSIMVGGFGLCGIPENLIKEIDRLNTQNIELIALDAGGDGFGLETWFEDHQVTKFITAYVGTNKLASAQVVAGTLDITLRPMGTLIEAIRCGGAGIPAFYTRTGVSTIVADGKPHKFFNGVEYIEETALHADIALVKAYKADEEGNLIFRKTARNSNPEIAMAGKITIVEVEEIVPCGTFDPDFIHLPGIYVDRIVQGKFIKPIEKLTFRER